MSSYVDRATVTMGQPRRLPSVGLVPMIVILLVAFMGVSAVAGFFLSASDQARLRESRAVTNDVRSLQQALIDGETGVRGFLLTSKFEYLEPYISGTQAIDGRLAYLLPLLDKFAATADGTAPEAAPVSRRVNDLRNAWRAAIILAGDGSRADADTSLQSSHAKSLMDELRAYLRRYLVQRLSDAQQAEFRIDIEQELLLLINTLGAALAIGGMGYGFWRSSRDTRDRELAIAGHEEARRHIEQLFSMADMLQSAIDRADANDVLRATGARMLVGFSGALYVFNNSRDRLDLATTWGDPVQQDMPDHITPGACWALKRGKPHLNTGLPHSLRCEHWSGSGGTLEIPMAARGELYGLLAISHPGDEAAAYLNEVRPLAIALADAMSLALSSIALREKLRNQALRDALTGLYNRRFLEETLERLTLDAERRAAPISAIMIDLDRFKRLNDQYGHATGDAVLRAVANAITHCLRATDLACRYGGEELAVLLPDCPLDRGVAIAEQIRAAIASSTSGLAPSVTASLGVAAVPETCARGSDLLSTADAALYQAKQAGRDRVVAAPVRPSAMTISLVEPPPAAASAD